MVEMSRANAHKLTGYIGTNLEECVNILLEFKNRGESVFIDFNNHKLYSCDVTMDSAYLEVCGMTKEKFNRIKEKWIENYGNNNVPEEVKAEAKAKIPEWIKRGERFIYPERVEEWKNCVEYRASDFYHGKDLDAALEIMETLESGATFDEAQKLLDSQDHDSPSYETVLQIIFEFSKQGPEFWEQATHKYIDSIRKKRLADQKQKNAKLKALHRNVSTERRKEEQKIIYSFTEKKAAYI